jgi:hypothetical protein
MAVCTQSSIPDVALALKAAWTAQLVADGLTTTQVVIGTPSQAVLDLKEFAAILDADAEVAVRALNRTTQPRDERYEQDVEVSVVYKSLDDSATAEARAFVIYSSLETLLRANWALSGYYNGPGALYAVVPKRLKLSRRASDQYREAALTITLDVHARP